MSFAGDGTYVGISGQRPTAGIGSGTRFIDRATGDDSYFDGSVWKQTPRNLTSGTTIGATSFTSSITLTSGVSGINFSGMQAPAGYITARLGSRAIKLPFFD